MVKFNKSKAKRFFAQFAPIFFAILVLVLIIGSVVTFAIIVSESPGNAGTCVVRKEDELKNNAQIYKIVETGYHKMKIVEVDGTKELIVEKLRDPKSEFVHTECP